MWIGKSILSSLSAFQWLWIPRASGQLGAAKTQELPARYSSARQLDCRTHLEFWQSPPIAEGLRDPQSSETLTTLSRKGGCQSRAPPFSGPECGASAGHVVECNVMDLMVGNRRAPGATILGGVLEYLTCQPSLLCPAD